MRGDETRERIKLAARRLFAERGVDGVSIREIVAAAGQRNVGSLHYYFRTKEALVRELVGDGARVINDRRTLMLEALRREGGPRTVRELIEVLVWPSVGLGDAQGEEDTYMRFIVSLTMNHRSLFLSALEGKWNAGYLQCVEHIRTLLQNLPEPIVNQRIVLMGIYLGAVLTTREAAYDRDGTGRDFWSAPSTMSNFIDTVQAMLEAPVSEHTRMKNAAPCSTNLFDLLAPPSEGAKLAG